MQADLVAEPVRTGGEGMEVRCPWPHPVVPGRPCGAILAHVEGADAFTLKCPRKQCGRFVRVRKR